MEKPTLLWIDMFAGSAVDEPRAEFSSHCTCRVAKQHQVAMILSNSRAMDAVCVNFEHADMDGLKFVAATKAKYPSLPIIVLLNEQSIDIVLWAMRGGIFDVLLKPVTARDVARCMRRLLCVLRMRPMQSERRNAKMSEAFPTETRYRAKRNSHDKLAAIADFLSKNYKQAISEREMAERCGLSVFQFSRIFRTIYGATFRDYLCDLRLACARRLLANPNISVTDVSAISGFNDPSYFARLFRARVGLSPTKFRRFDALAQLSSSSLDLEVPAVGNG